MKIDGRKVLITGGSVGIGRQLAGDLVDRGARVLVCGRDLARLDDLRTKLPRVDSFVCDVRDYASIVALRDYAEQTFGTPDLLMNNAAVFRRFDVEDASYSIDSWLEEIDINLLGTLRVTHAFLPAMTSLPGATIVNVTSAAGYVPIAAAPIYSATKAALQSWTVSLRHQLKDSSVRVIELNPPAVDTRMNKNNPGVEGLKLWSTRDFSQHVIRQLERKNGGDILVGDAKLVHRLSRVVPGMVFNKMNPTHKP